MGELARFKREIGGMSGTAWAVVCACCFVIALGAGLGAFQPAAPTPEVMRHTPPGARTTPVAASPASRSRANAPARFTLCDGARAVDCVVDGDTFRLDGETIRVADIDAPETVNAKCASERALGERAKARLTELLNMGGFSLRRYDSREHDRYGRKLFVVMRGERSLGGVLVAESLAREWSGRRRPWCE